MIEFLKALPGLVGLLREIFEFIKKLAAENPGKFISEAHEAMEKLNNAKTTEERIDSAKRIQSLIGKL